MTSSEKSSSSSLFSNPTMIRGSLWKKSKKRRCTLFREKTQNGGENVTVSNRRRRREIRKQRAKDTRERDSTREVAREITGEDERVSTGEREGRERGVGGTKSEKEWDQRKSGSSSGREMFATGCLCAYYLYCFYDVEDPFKFDRKMATLVPLFWVACLAVNSNGVNKLATVANLILTDTFLRFGACESEDDERVRNER